MKIRCVEHAHYVQLAAAPAWNREKQMFVAKGKEFDMIRFKELHRSESHTGSRKGRLLFGKMFVFATRVDSVRNELMSV